MDLMLTVLVSCLFGAVSAMMLWAAGSASETRNQMMRRGGKLAPPKAS